MQAAHDIPNVVKFFFYIDCVINTRQSYSRRRINMALRILISCKIENYHVGFIEPKFQPQRLGINVVLVFDYYLLTSKHGRQKSSFFRFFFLFGSMLFLLSFDGVGCVVHV